MGGARNLALTQIALAVTFKLKNFATSNGSAFYVVRRDTFNFPRGRYILIYSLSQLRLT